MEHYQHCSTFMINRRGQFLTGYAVQINEMRTTRQKTDYHLLISCSILHVQHLLHRNLSNTFKTVKILKVLKIFIPMSTQQHWSFFKSVTHSKNRVTYFPQFYSRRSEIIKLRITWRTANETELVKVVVVH